ncbi:MAG: hypothetical protein U0Y10_12375 [Spirosomataceae bacterium]
MKKQALSFLLFIVFITFGCKDDKGIVETSYQNQYLVTALSSDIPYLVTTPQNFDPALEFAKLEAFYHEIGVDDVMSLAQKDWKIVDQEYRQILRKYESHTYINMLRQVVAQNILLKKGLLDNDSKDATNAISFYTDELIKGGSTNTPLIYSCLARLKTSWKTQKIQEVSIEAVTSYQSLVERNQKARQKRVEEVKNLTAAQQKLYDKIMAMRGKSDAMQADYAKKLAELAGK